MAGDALDRLRDLAPRFEVDDALVMAARRRTEEAIASEDGTAARPRRHGRMWWGAVAAVATTATVVAVLWPGSTPDAYASWTAVPAPASAGQVQAASSACDRVLDARSSDWAAEESANGSRPNTPASSAQLADRRVVLAEQRGEFTLTVSSNSRWVVECLTALTVSDQLTEVGFTDLSRYPAATSAGGVDVLGMSAEGASGSSAALVYGRAGVGVIGVDLLTADGRTVRGSVADGFWSAWWPTDPGQQMAAAGVVVRLSDGTAVGLGSIGDLTPSTGSPS